MFGIVALAGIEEIEKVGDRGFFSCNYNSFHKKKRAN